MGINVETAEYKIAGKFQDDISAKSKKAFDQFKRNSEIALKAFAVAATAALTTFVVTIAKVIKAANEQELAIAKLEGTLRSTNQFTKEYSQTLQEQASAFQKVTQFGDEVILGNQGLLISMGATQENIKQVTQASLDLAAGMGVDLRSATLLMGKALAGEFGSLSKYGIIVDDNATKSEKLAQTLEQVQQKFGGQAQAQANTFAGRLTQLRNAFGDLLEEIGFIFTTSPTLNRFLVTVKEQFEEWGRKVKDTRGELQDFLNNVIQKFITDIPTIVNEVKILADISVGSFKALRVAVEAMVVAFRTLQLLFETTKGAVNALTGNTEAYNKNFQEMKNIAHDIVTIFDRWGASLNQTAQDTIIADSAIVSLEKTTRLLGKSKVIQEGLGKLGQDLRELGSNKRLDELKALFAQMENLEELDKQLKGNDAFQFGFSTDTNSAEFQAFHASRKQFRDEVEAIGVEIKKNNQFAQDFSRVIATGFEDAAIKGEKLRDVLRALGLDAVRILFRATLTKPLETGITNALQGFNFASLFSGFGGARAEGGAVNAGSTFLVGERGPELFTPSRSGSIVPNKNLGSNITVNQTIVVQPGISQTVRAEMINLLPAFRREAIAGVIDAQNRNKLGGAFG